MKLPKFRAWINSKEMVYLPFACLRYFDFEGAYTLSFVVDGYPEFYAHECYESKKIEFELMEWTEITDEAGVEIFAGDLREYEGKVFEVVKIHHQYCLRRTLFGCGENLTIALNEDVVFLSKHIGNKYEK